MRNNVIENNIWDKGQLGAAKGVLGTSLATCIGYFPTVYGYKEAIVNTKF